jgi:hypothetical protein
MTTTARDRRSEGRWRLLGWGGAAALLCLPLVAGAPWTGADFMVMGAMLGSAGLGLELAARASGDNFYRAGAGAAILAAFLLVWVNLAVGFLGDEANPANLIFALVLAIAILGSVLAGLRAAGMARAMAATAAAQALAGAIALAAGLGSPGSDGPYEIAMGTSVFTALWLVAAGLFRKAAANRARAPR